MKSQWSIVVFFSIAVMLKGCGIPGQNSDAFYIAVDGNDSWSGRLAETNENRTDGPFATFERAQETVRGLIAANVLPEGGVTVFIRGGVYSRSAAFDLGAEDSGTETAPVTWRAYGSEIVRIIGGKRIGEFSPVSDAAVRGRFAETCRDSILKIDLKAAGIDDFGTIRPRGFGRRNEPAALELFFDGKPMTFARWPNDGWVTIADVPTKQLDPADVNRTADSGKGMFVYEDGRPARWRDTGDVWLHGYWTWDWADSYERIKTIDQQTRTIATFEPHGVYGYKKGQRYYYLNILEELDRPGEWYLDRSVGILYFWPPSPVTQAEAIVSLLEEPLIRMDNTSNITFRGCILENTRGNAVVINGGSHNSIAGCILRNIGNVGVIIDGGTDNGVTGCDIYETGDGGVRLSGGDRKTLTPAGNYAANNNIYNYSRWVRTYRPAVQISGVGNRAANNHIHDAPHMGIGFGGNDHVLEFNEVNDICRETGDVGAFYIGRDWTMRGHVIRHNFFHHIEGPYTHGAMSVYLDDAASGTLIYGNVFYKASRAAFIGGGRDNTVKNNIFVDCHPSVHIDARGIGWAASRIAPGGSWHMYEKLNAMSYDKPPYSKHYPDLVSLPEDEPALPKGNIIKKNISYGGRWLDVYNDLDNLKIVTVENNFTEGDPLFVDPDNMNFQLNIDSPAYGIGFKRIPFEKIGLFEDEFRKSLPMEHR